MRRAGFPAALVAILLLTGCSLTKSDDDCAHDPGGLGGTGTTVCTKPPPAQFSKLG